MSQRYALPVIILLAVALIPTVIHNYMEAKTKDGLITSAIPATIAGFTSTQTKRLPNWGETTFDSNDWVERQYTDSTGKAVRLFVARSYDPKQLYHHPELAIVYGVDLKDAGKVQVDGARRIPVHLLRGRTSNGLAAYSLLYDGEFVENPITFQIRTSWQAIFRPRKQMTLFFVYDGDAVQGVGFDAQPAAQVLVGAVNGFISQGHKGLP